MNERQSKIILFALAFLKSNISADPEVEDQLTNSIGESGGALTVEKEIELLEQAVQVIPTALPTAQPTNDEYGDMCTDVIE